MANGMLAADVLGRELLEIRAKLLEIGAALDRVDRAEGGAQLTQGRDPRLARIHRALAVLGADQSERAEQIQLIFSLPYQEDWQSSLQVATRR